MGIFIKLMMQLNEQEGTIAIYNTYYTMATLVSPSYLTRKL